MLITVTDTRSGISEEVAAKVFDPFLTANEAGKGTGLGLSQVCGFVKQSSGHVKIYSELGQGTTFEVYLPRCIGAVERNGEQLLDRYWSLASKTMRTAFDDLGKAFGGFLLMALFPIEGASSN